MKISRLIELLKGAQEVHGDLPVVVEVADMDCVPVEYRMKPVGELAVEDRKEHGLSVGLLI
jgi:hypothetical protein